MTDIGSVIPSSYNVRSNDSVHSNIKNERNRFKESVSTSDKAFQKSLNQEIAKYNNSQSVKRGITHKTPENKSTTPLGYLKQKAPKTVADKYRAAIESSNKSPDPELGMNIALKKLAKDFGTQFYALMWQRVRTGNPDSSFGERVWDSELTREIVESGAGDELDPLEQAIFEELKAGIKERDVKGFNK
jgi:hypothetical protein